ncbi:hypothetical protein BaRGS_00001244 [Batillaria attramentaria]|uniref:Uncharacterized protein n=1 Tax=Batillaria attramentaria TaxID=370345 RepID=A0ABD0M7F5_9CAEN
MSLRFAPYVSPEQQESSRQSLLGPLVNHMQNSPDLDRQVSPPFHQSVYQSSSLLPCLTPVTRQIRRWGALGEKPPTDRGTQNRSARARQSVGEIFSVSALFVSGFDPLRRQ